MRELKNISASVNAHLQKIAKEQSKPFQEILQYYGIERFLYRLSQTEFRDLFILKGGLIFYALGYPLRRPTRDIDFRGFTKNSIDNLTNIIKETCSLQTIDDGLVFSVDSIKVEETMVNADYLGLSVSLDAYLGPAKIPIQIDIGFTDDITPGPETIEYPTLLGMNAPVLRRYPVESIISEKFHAMVRFGEINSRWKDFYDIWMLTQSQNFDGAIIKSAILATFDRRSTPIPTTIPLPLTDDYAISQQKQWEMFVHRNNLDKSGVSNFSNVIAQIRSFLMPPLQALVENYSFDKCWIPGEGWK